MANNNMTHANMILVNENNSQFADPNFDPNHPHAHLDISIGEGVVLNHAPALNNRFEHLNDSATTPFIDDIDGTLQRIVQLQVEAEREDDKDAAEGYGKLYTSTVQIRRVLTENDLIHLMEPLNLIIDRVYDYVHQYGFKILFSSTFNPKEIGEALESFIHDTIRLLPDPDLKDPNYMLARNIVNPIVETANCMLEAFGEWMAPAVEHICDTFSSYLNPLYEEAILQLGEIKDQTMTHFIHLPTIEKIYLGDSLIQLLQFGYANSEFIINSLLETSEFSKAIFEFTTNTANTLYQGINGTRRLIMNIQGMSFNMLVFLIISSKEIYHRRHPDTMEKDFKNLCVDYAGTALFKIREAYARTHPDAAREIAMIYGNIIYHAINTTLLVVKEIHLFGYAANPYLIGGFVAYTVGIYINRFHSEPISLFDAFVQTFGFVFGDELPDAVDKLIKKGAELTKEIMDRQHELEAEGVAAQTLVNLMNAMGQHADIAVNENPLLGAANEAVNENLLPGAAAGPANNTVMGNASANGPREGGKARRRKTIKKKHAKKAHKGKSKKAGKVRKVKKARKSKAKKAHKGKRHTKRRS